MYIATMQVSLCSESIVFVSAVCEQEVPTQLNIARIVCQYTYIYHHCKYVLCSMYYYVFIMQFHKNISSKIGDKCFKYYKINQHNSLGLWTINGSISLFVLVKFLALV